MAAFAVLKRLGIALSRLWGILWAVSKIRGPACACLAFLGFPADRLQWRFTCFGFGYGLDCNLWLLLWSGRGGGGEVGRPCSVVPVGAMGPSSPGDSPFWAGWPFPGCEGLVGCVQN